MSHKPSSQKLTSKTVQSARIPGLIWDVADSNADSVKGFGLRVHGGGTKSFFINYRIDGRERRKTIGSWPTWSVSAARAEAKILRQAIDRGEDPAGQKRERLNAPTIQDLINRYVNDYLPTKPSAQRQTNSKIAAQRITDEKKMADLVGEHLGRHTKVADVHGGDIEEMHRKITKSRGPVRANRTKTCASKMFSLSLMPLAGENTAWRDQAQGNPCKGVASNHEEPRERFFNKFELEQIADALNEYEGAVAGPNCIRLIMLTGCRPSEAMQARWSEFDSEPNYWIKPSANTKQRRTHKAPLSPPAGELINKLRKERTGDWVFPGLTPGEPLATLGHVWRFVRERAKLHKDDQGHEARIYDLRHSFAAVGAGGGLSLPIIGRLLGHTTPRTTARYAHLADDPLREAAERIGAVIDGSGTKLVSVKQ